MFNFIGLWIVQLFVGISGLLMPNKDLAVKPLKILIISDLNSSYGSTHYTKEVASVLGKIDSIKPDLILCAGDMVAGQKASITRDETKAMWQAFDDQVFKKIQESNIPFGFTIGNHDGSPNFKQDRELATEFWTVRKSATKLNFLDSSHFPYYYSFEQEGVFIASWDASASVIKEDVYKWLEEQLRSPEAKKAKMRILLGHLPLYAIVDSKNKPGEVNSDADTALLFFKRHKVDMYISGHQHAYYPAKKDKIVFLNSGAIGEGERKFIGSNTPAIKAYSVLEIRGKARFSIDTWNPSTNEKVKLEDLPAFVEGFNGKSYRLD